MRSSARCAKSWRTGRHQLGTEHPSLGLNCMRDLGYTEWASNRHSGITQARPPTGWACRALLAQASQPSTFPFHLHRLMLTNWRKLDITIVLSTFFVTARPLERACTDFLLGQKCVYSKEIRAYCCRLFILLDLY